MYGNPGISGLVAGYDFSEGGGMMVNDFSGNGYDGTLLSGTSWTTGKVLTEASYPTATFSTSELSLGMNSITLAYSGDGNYPACSTSLQEVVQAASSITLAASSSPTMASR